jgi:hypothetical protein
MRILPKCSLIVIAVLALAGPARLSWAGQFESAQGQLSKSYNDMYKALKGSPNPRADGPQLYQQKIVPAQAEVSRAIKAQSQETGKRLDAQWKAEQAEQARQKASQHATDRITKTTRAKPGVKTGPTDKLKRPEGGGGDGGSGGNNPVAAQAPKPQYTPETATRPKTVLDGSKVPRELEFGGPKKADPPSAPAPK